MKLILDLGTAFYLFQVDWGFDFGDIPSEITLQGGDVHGLTDSAGHFLHWPSASLEEEPRSTYGLRDDGEWGG